MKYFICIALLLFPVISFCLGGWKTLSSDHFIVYHQKGYEQSAVNLLKTLEAHREFASELCGNTRGKIPIQIEDIGAMANGYANPVGNKISVFTHFPTDGALANLEDWWTMVGVHEYIHILQMSNEGGIPKALRIAFGNIFYPNLLIPMWMLEGITVFGESSLSPYSGRLNGGYYPAIVRSMAFEDMLPSINKANQISHDTPLSNFYVVGSAFFDFLADTYGQESFAEFFTANGKKISSYLSPLFPALGMDATAKEVYGKSFKELWNNWRKYESYMAKDMHYPEAFLSHSGWLKENLKLHEGKLYYTQREVSKTSAASQFAASQIISYDPITSRSNVILSQAESFACGYQVTANKLYYTRLELKKGFANTEYASYGYVPQLWEMNLRDKRKKKLYEGSFRAFWVNEDESVLLSMDKLPQGSQILLLKDAKLSPVYEDDQFTIHGIIKSDNHTFVNARKHWRNSSIYMLKDNMLIPLVDTPNRETLHSVQDDKVFFDTNYGDFLHTYVYDIKSDITMRADGADYMTDAIAFQDKLFYLGMNSGGIDLASDPLGLTVYVVPDFVELEPVYTPFVAELNANAIKDLGFKKGGYAANLRHLAVPRHARIPFVEGTLDSLKLGITLSGADVVGHFPNWQSTISYDLKRQKSAFDFGITNAFFAPLMQDIYYSSLDGQYLESNQYYLLYQRVNYGIRSIVPGFSFGTKDDYSRKIWTPYIDTGYSAKGLNGVNRFYAKAESKEYFASSRKRLGWGMYHNAKMQLSDSSELQSNLHLASDPDADLNEVFIPLRGYKTDIMANQGIRASMDYRRLAFKVREGLWNPNVYVEDISAGIFADAFVPFDKSADAKYAFGMEMMVELSTMFWVNTVLGFRVAVNKEQEIVPGFFMSGGF